MGTEVNALKIELQAKDAKIRELKIEINCWQETHSQIYDSFTSATKLYREQIERFNDEKNDLQQQLKLIKSRKSNEQIMGDDDDMNGFDIESELEFNSDISSSESSDDSIGGGHGLSNHVRRGSKPWMQIKRRMERKKAKKAKNKSKERLLAPSIMPTLSTLVSQQESIEESTPSLLIRTNFKLKHQDTDISVFTDLETPDDDAPDYQLRFTEMGIPLQPQLHHKDGQSHVGTSLFDGSVNLKASEFADNDGIIVLNIKENKWNELVNELKNIKNKCNELEIENRYVIESKIKLLQNTSMEINKLKRIVNAILNINNQQKNIKDAINKMLKSM